jgi:hypothetical protein
LTVKCPECGYSFSDKRDYTLYASGEFIQCPVCQTQLKVNREGVLEALFLKENKHEL